LEEHARTAKHWYDWQEGIELFIDKKTQDNNF
jgi:hypothetical protein